MSLVAISDQTLSYGARDVLANVSISIAAGERVALLGRSGAGKSTLLTQLYQRMAKSQPVVALIPQDDALVPALSVYNNIYMGRLDQRSALYNIANLVRPRDRDITEVQSFAASVAMADSLWQSVGTLSGGQKQRTAIARALYRGGPIVLADEPVSAVDVQQGAQILAALGERFETVVLAMHDVDLAVGFATRLVGLKNGRIVFDGATAKVARSVIQDLYAN